jgi:hypothetical protein
MEQLKIVIDQQVLSTLYAGIAAKNKGTGAGVISSGLNFGVTGAPLIPQPSAAVGTTPTLPAITILDLIVNMGQALDEYNIPETGRWLILPPWLGSMVKKSDLRNASISGDGISLVRNGRLGMIDRFTLYSSNLLPSLSSTPPLPADGTHTNPTQIFAGHSAGLTFASQISEMETLRSESTFGTLLRGLQVYGAQVIDGTTMVGAYLCAT